MRVRLTPGTPGVLILQNDKTNQNDEATSDDDVLSSVKEVTGEEPKEGETLADIVNRAEAERHHPPKSEEGEKAA